MIERRRYRRIQASFPVECNMLAGRKYFYTVSRDISLGGVQIISNRFIPKNSIVKLTINFIDSLFTIKAKIAWCNKKRVSDRYNAGFEFIEMSQTHSQQINHSLDNLCVI